MEFETQIIDLEEKELWGLKVETSMGNAMADCPKLWEDFAKYLNTVNGIDLGQVDSYGLSIMVSEVNFVYWVVIDNEKNYNLGEKVEKIIFPKGLYLKIELDSLDKISEAYMYAYETWPKATESYKLDCLRPCSEFYSTDYSSSGRFNILVPINEV